MEHLVGTVDMLADGQMKRLEVAEKAIVLARVAGEYHAFRASCTHYGGPLDKGTLRGHTIMCPWHHACFDMRSGARVEPPALSNVPAYPLRIADGHIYVDLDASITPAEPDSVGAGQAFIIVGGGGAGHAAAEELRKLSFAGKIVLVSAAEHAPVDRPNVSKDYLAGTAKPEWMPLRGREWYVKNNIGVRLNTRVTGVDTARHSITLEDGTSLAYDKLLLATGARPRLLENVAGSALENILALREQVDADRIIEAVDKGRKVVVVGASFIGTEVASSLGSRGANVTVVGLETVPFENVMGREVGRLFQRVHEENGVSFRLNSRVGRFLGENGRVSGVELEGGEVLPADVVVIGVGVAPATGFLANAGIDLHERDGSVLVDNHLQTSAPDVYAAGDIARYPNPDGGTTRIEHWRVALQHGMIAAHNMLGKQDAVNAHVPFFWTTQWGLGLRYVGHAEKWDEIIYRGDPMAKDFIAFYVSNGVLRAASGMGRDRELTALEFILRDRLPLSTDQMRNADVDLVAYAEQHPLAPVSSTRPETEA